MADILKVSHHGSKTGTDPDIIKLINPSMALIGVGEGNSYGHPANQILDILNQSQINIFRTDLNGNIQITFEDFIKVKTDN
jgi:competence protein ComEC